MPAYPDPITVFVVDDHTLFRRGLMALIGQDAGLQVIGDASDASEVLRNGAQGTPAAAASVSPSPLSPREEEVLREIAQGASNKEIARRLDIAETTVKIHVQHILRKLGLSSRVQAAVYASDRIRSE